MKSLNEAITNHAFFHGVKPEHLALLTEGAKGITFKADDVLFREGEPANQFYLIERGKITVETHEPANGTMLVQSHPREHGAGRGDFRARRIFEFDQTCPR